MKLVKNKFKFIIKINKMKFKKKKRNFGGNNYN